MPSPWSTQPYFSPSVSFSLESVSNFPSCACPRLLCFHSPTASLPVQYSLSGSHLYQMFLLHDRGTPLLLSAAFRISSLQVTVPCITLFSRSVGVSAGLQPMALALVRALTQSTLSLSLPFEFGILFRAYELSPACLVFCVSFCCVACPRSFCREQRRPLDPFNTASGTLSMPQSDPSSVMSLVIFPRRDQSPPAIFSLSSFRVLSSCCARDDFSTGRACWCRVRAHSVWSLSDLSQPPVMVRHGNISALFCLQCCVFWISYFLGFD